MRGRVTAFFFFFWRVAVYRTRPGAASSTRKQWVSGPSSRGTGRGWRAVAGGALRPRARAAAASPARQRGRRSPQTTASLTSWFLGNWGEAHNSPAPESPTSLRLGSPAPAASALPDSCRRCPPNPP